MNLKRDETARTTQYKIGHSSRSSSIQRSKITADQRCMVITIFGKFNFPISIEKRWTKDKQTDRQNKEKKNRQNEEKKNRQNKEKKNRQNEKKKKKN